MTGHEAADVTRQGRTLTSSLDQIEKTTGKEKDAMLKAFSVVCSVITSSGIIYFSHVISKELGQADISIIKKAELRDRLAAMRKAFDKQTKEREQSLQKAVSNSFDSL